MQEFLKRLKEEHGEVKEILDELQSTRSGSKHREDLFSKLKQELVPHTKSEEKVFYNRLMESDSSAVRQHVLEGFEEHRLAEMLLNELDAISKQEEIWPAKFKVFSENVEHHIEEEESNVFSDAQKELSDDELDEILEAFVKMKQDIMADIAT